MCKRLCKFRPPSHAVQMAPGRPLSDSANCPPDYSGSVVSANVGAFAGKLINAPLILDLSGLASHREGLLRAPARRKWKQPPDFIEMAFEILLVLAGQVHFAPDRCRSGRDAKDYKNGFTQRNSCTTPQVLRGGTLSPPGPCAPDVVVS
jgi:hypothetical protein